MPTYDDQDNTDILESGINNEEDSVEQTATVPRLTKSQKIGTAVLAFFAFIIIIFWFAQFRRGLSSPFQYQPANQNAIQKSSTCTGPNCASEEAKLKAQDTDNDGLSDWDEINIYQTSPYLEDSDSDGVWDKEEIDSDKDPNCPIGRDCSTRPVEGSTGSAVQNTLNDTGDVSSLLGDLSKETKGDNKLSEKDMNALMSGDFNADTLRQLLISNGLDKKVLDQISDEDLMSSFLEIISEQ